jgi:hypothetical protein
MNGKGLQHRIVGRELQVCKLRFSTVFGEQRGRSRLPASVCKRTDAAAGSERTVHKHRSQIC